MRGTLVFGIICLAFLAAVGTVSAANLVANGGFEVPVNTASWQIYPDGTPGMVWHAEGIDPAHPGYNDLEIQTQSTLGLVPYEGKQYAELDPYYNVRISQDVYLQKDHSYLLSYAQSCRGDDPSLPSKLQVTMSVPNAGSVLATTQCDRNDVLKWTVHTVPFAPSADGVLSLSFEDQGVSNSYGVLLDDVKLEDVSAPSPAPEFPTIAVPVGMILGAVLIVYTLRSRKD